MEILKKFYCFLVAIVALFATIGCTAYLFYFGKPIFAAACVCLAAMAAHYVIAKVKELLK